MVFAKADRLIIFIALAFSLAGWSRLLFATFAFGIAASAFGAALTAAKWKKSREVHNYVSDFLWRFVAMTFFAVAMWRVGINLGYF
jgi:hypothetical protein